MQLEFKSKNNKKYTVNSIWNSIVNIKKSER